MVSELTIGLAATRLVRFGSSQIGTSMSSVSPREFAQPTKQLDGSPSQALRTYAWARREELLLAPYAMFSIKSEGRKYSEVFHAYRGPFQRDRDRILHCAAFRRLSGKMQVFTGDMGDYHRTRLTHTHEVATIARTIGRTLRLNEDLIEALALVHDIGHPPFGHSGEDALHRCLAEHGGFSHNQFALTLVEDLETRYTTYPGLNLSREVLVGQNYRTTHQGQAPLLEVQVVDLADSIAYNAHDADDALKLGLLHFSQLASLQLAARALEWSAGTSVAGISERARRQVLAHNLIDVQVADLLESVQRRWGELPDMDSLTLQQLGYTLEFSGQMLSERKQFGDFMFANVYRHPQLVKMRKGATTKLEQLFERLVKHPDYLPSRFQDRAQQVGVPRSVGEYIAGMTDRFCDQQHRQLVELGETSAADWY
jgi:dGTPase